MKVFLLLLTTLFFAWTGSAQKLIKKSVLDDNVQQIQIDANNCFEVDLSTHKSNNIVIEAQIDGEYSQDLDLKVLENGNTVMVSAGFQANFKHPNDKLSAHKVISIALTIVLPEWKHVLVYGSNTRVIGKGVYENLDISLADGSCNLVDVSQNVSVRTQSGDISVSSTAATVTMNNKYGEVSSNPIPNGRNQFNLNTVTGNIYLNKTE